MKKKTITAALAVMSAALVTGSAVFAASRYTKDDLQKLSSSLLGGSAVTEEQDVNGDGVVDAYDLAEMRKTFTNSGSGEFTEQIFDVSETNVRYIGRNIYDDEKIAWLVQSGSAIEFNVTGKSAEITINGDGFTESDEKYRPRYAVIVDGEIILDELLSVKEKQVTLFEGSASRTASVKVIHLSEANNGAIGVSKVKVNSDVAVPVLPTAKKDLQIEFVGDSITCAYGVEGASQYESFMTSTENFMKSYAYLTAKQLDADYSAVSYSGHGIVSGYSSSGDAMTDSLVPDYYEYVGKLGTYKQPWDFDSHQSDVVVVNLGTNDNTYTSKEPETRSMEYAEKYTEFLELIHEKNPDAYIICTLGTMGCTELYPYIEIAVEDFKSNTGYDRIMCYQSATHTQNDGMGSDWHPSEKTQQNSAYVLADKICQCLGMESDQIGINVAVDATYSVEQEGENMMSAYFSEWDGSYHVTVTNGGSSSEAIKAYYSGIDLRKGGSYHFSFQLETTEGAEIPMVVRSRKTGEVIFEDTIVGGSGRTEYSADFESDITADSEIVFSIGGQNSLRFSIYETKMVKYEQKH